MAETDTPFVWGAGGEQLTPGQLSSRRKIADAMMAQGMDSSPIRSVWQGVDRMAKAMLGAYQGRQADEQEATARQAAISQLMGALGASPATGAGAAETAPAPAAAAASPAPAPVDGTAPAGRDRDAAVRTILAEARNQGPIGMQAVASVIRNRALDGGYGGRTPYEVVTARNQFEPWNTPEGRARMAAIDPNSGEYRQASEALDRAWAGDDPTGGKTMFYSPSLQAQLGRPAPSWAQGEGQRIGDHVFFNGAGTTPAAASPAVRTVMAAAAPSASAAPGGPSTAQLITAMSNPFLPPQMAAIAAARLKPHESHTQVTDAAGNIWDVNQVTGQRTLALKKDPAFGDPYRDDSGNLLQKDATGKISVISAADKTPTSVNEYDYYRKNFAPSEQQPQPMDYATWSTAKARAAATNITNNVDLNASQSYDKQLAEGLGKAHASLANGVEDAEIRARDVAAMQGAIDAIQKNGGTTGGLAPERVLGLQKAINGGAAALGMNRVFDEKDLSDKEFLTKFNRSMAGAQAKGAMGSRVTNFEMSNYLKANPGLDMSITGNQRLLGIQAQIEQRNVAVGNAIRMATAEAISKGRKIDPVTVQKLISEYDEAHHIQDPVTGQDLTQSYVLPEFQSRGSNPALSGQHDENVGKIRRYNPATGALE